MPEWAERAVGGSVLRARLLWILQRVCEEGSGAKWLVNFCGATRRDDKSTDQLVGISNRTRKGSQCIE